MQSSRQRGPRWPLGLALVWSASYAVLALVWVVNGHGFPFGVADPEGRDMISILAGVPERGGAIAAAVLSLAGALVAAAMAQPRGHRLLRRPLLVFSWALAASLVLLLPDIRVLQNFAYLFMLVFAKFDWHVFHQVWLIVGGVIWAAAAVVYQRRTNGGCARCGRIADVQGWTSPGAAARWGRVAAYTAAIVSLPYPVMRGIASVGLILGFSPVEVGLPAPTAGNSPESSNPAYLAWATGTFAVLGIGGAILILGLVHRWGEVFPRWIPGLRGRRVPPALAIVPATMAAVALAAAGLKSTFQVVTGSGDGYWSGTLLLNLWAVWGLALGVAVLGYHLRRRGSCRTCGQPEAQV